MFWWSLWHSKGDLVKSYFDVTQISYRMWKVKGDTGANKNEWDFKGLLKSKIRSREKLQLSIRDPRRWVKMMSQSPLRLHMISSWEEIFNIGTLWKLDLSHTIIGNYNFVVICANEDVHKGCCDSNIPLQMFQSL